MNYLTGDGGADGVYLFGYCVLFHVLIGCGLTTNQNRAESGQESGCFFLALSTFKQRAIDGWCSDETRTEPNPVMTGSVMECFLRVPLD